MVTLSLRLQNASRQPLPDTVDVDVRDQTTNALVASARDVTGTKTLKFSGLGAGRTYAVRVFPKRFRPVGRFVATPNSGKGTDVTVCCPVVPERVTRAVFESYTALSSDLKTVLEASTLEDAGSPGAGATHGERLFASLGDLQRAGLMNLYCKMRNTPLGDRPVWSFVTDLYRIRGDRVFANVSLGLRDRVKTAVSAGLFHPADESLHTPPNGFERAGSFKSEDRYGNLQLSFFSSATMPLTFKVDADIDDAAGIEHAFQVIGNAVKGGTHPYDIHEILAYYQQLTPGYELLV